jgi:putative ABC transport system permease protein
MATMVRDALHGLRAGRGTTTLAFAIFTLAIAAGTVTYSVVDTVAFRRLPYGDADRLIAIPRLDRLGGFSPASPQDYFAWSGRLEAVEMLGMYRNNIVQALERGGPPERLSVARVTANFFDVLRVRPAAGRLFGPEHDMAGGDAVIVLSHALWVRGFAADPNAIGQTVTLGKTPRQIVGVLEPGVAYPVGLEPATDAYIPTVATAAERSDDAPGRTYNAFVVGRLRPGATVAQAQQQVDAINAARQHGDKAADRLHVPQPLLDYVVGPAKSWLVLVLAGVGCVLLVACVNVASLFLTRATARMRELATREVLGASRRRIAATLLLEGLLLSVTAGLAGVGIALWAIEIVKTALPAGLARASMIALDARVLTVCGVVVIVCGAAFASAPAWLAARVDLWGATRATSGSVIGGRGRARSLRLFLIGETAFVSALLVATALVVTSFVLITTFDLGFDRRNVMAFGVQKSLRDVPEADRPATSAAFRADLLQRIKSLPGVASAAMISLGLPFVSGSSSYSVGLPGQSGQAGGPMFAIREITPEYFDTMGLQLIRGRAIQASDRAGTPSVGLINDTAARQFFANEEPLGKTLTFRGPVVIVGVIRSVRNFGPEVAAQPELYIALDQSSGNSGDLVSDLVVRTAVPAPDLAATVRDAARVTVGTGDVFEARFLEEAYARRNAGRRFNATLMTMFGGIALVIAAIGIYGTFAFVVAQDVRAIGLRLALGATPGGVRRLILGEAMRRVGVGIATGLAVAWTVSSWFASVVFGVTPTNPTIYLLVAVVVAAVALVAALVPALRASRLDPLIALKSE